MSRDRHLNNNGATAAIRAEDAKVIPFTPSLPPSAKTPITLQITEDDRTQAMQLLNEELFREGGARQEVLGNIVLAIFRNGIFRGARTVGAVIVDDRTRPVTFKGKFKALFRRG
jgi:hypothetical protein